MRATPSSELGPASCLQRTLPSSSFPLPCTTVQLNPLESSFKPKSLKSFNLGFRLASSSKPVVCPPQSSHQYLDTFSFVSSLPLPMMPTKLDVAPRLHPISECTNYQMVALISVMFFVVVRGAKSFKVSPHFDFGVNASRTRRA